MSKEIENAVNAAKWQADTACAYMIHEWQDGIHDWAIRKGWWDTRDGIAILNRDPLALLMLIVTEAAEAAEEMRNPDIHFGDIYAINKESKRVPYMAVQAMNEEQRLEMFGREIPKPEGFTIELADIIIRCMDTAQAFGLDLAKAMALKMAYNETRPPRHGGKRA